MFRNVLSKVVGFGLALCIMGIMVFSVPDFRVEMGCQHMNDATIPFNIHPPENGDDD